MNILINGEALEGFEYSEEMSMGELLEQLYLFLKERKLTAVKILVDETQLSHPISSEISLAKVGSYSKIDCQVESLGESKNIETLIKEAIEDSPEVIPHLTDQLATIVSHLRVAELNKAMETMVEFIEGLDWICTVSKNLEFGYKEKLVEYKLDEVRNEILELLRTQINDLFQSQQNQDWVGVADILEYEIKPLLDRHFELFSRLNSSVQ